MTLSKIFVQNMDSEKRSQAGGKECSLEFGTIHLENGDVKGSGSTKWIEEGEGSHSDQGLQESFPEEENSDFRPKKHFNETKNIPKNYGKAIIAFIVKRRDEFRVKLGASRDEFD